MLAVRKISFNYHDTTFKGLQSVSLDLAPGNITAIAGPSGSGKSTLLKCIYGLEDLAAGEISVDGEAVKGPAYNLIPGHENMRLVSQDYYVLDNHTVSENLFDKLAGFNETYKASRAKNLLRLLELQAIRDMRCRNLSSGQKQRVALGRALAVLPKILLLDEPFSNLDTILKEKVLHFIKREVKRKKTAVLMVTHDSETALCHADDILLMKDGKVQQYGPARDVYYKPRHAVLGALLGPINVLHARDLEKNSPFKKQSRIMFRPDRLELCDNKADLTALVASCDFNGKCFQILLNLGDSKHIQMFHHEQIKPGKRIKLRILS